MEYMKKEAFEALQASAADAVRSLEEGKSVREVLKDIYCSLPDKSEDIGYRMADYFATLVEEYHGEVERCLKDRERYVDEELAAAVRGKNLTDTCNAYHRMLTALDAWAIISLADPDDKEEYEAALLRADAYVSEKGKEEFDETTATEAKAEELRKAVRSGLVEANMANTLLPSLLKEMQDETMEVTTLVPEYGRKSKELKQILSMQAYVNAKNGSLEGVGPDVSMKEITYTTCAAVDACAVGAKVEEGSMEEEQAKNILDAIGLVIGKAVLTAAALFITYKVTRFLISYYAIETLIGKIAAVFAGKCTASWAISEETKEKVYGVSTKAATAVGYAVKEAKGLVVKGLRKLAEMSEEGRSKAADYVKGKVEEVRDMVQEYVQAGAEKEPAAGKEKETVKPLKEKSRMGVHTRKREKV